MDAFGKIISAFYDRLVGVGNINLAFYDRLVAIDNIILAFYDRLVASQHCPRMCNINLCSPTFFS